MALSFDFSEMVTRLGQELYDEITDSPYPPDDGEGPQWHPITKALINYSMAIGLNHIHKDNVDEWIKRINAVQGLHGPDLTAVVKDIDGENPEYMKTYVTKEDVTNHIGMRTNVTRMTSSEFAARLVADATGEGAAACRNQGRAGIFIVRDHAKQLEEL